MNCPKKYQIFFNQKGFSLIEIILGLVIVGFIISIIMNLPTALRIIGTSKYETLAKEIASKKIEDLRSIGYAGICSPDTAVTPPTPCIQQITASENASLGELPTGTGEVRVDVCDTCTNDEAIKKVTVKINWLDQGSNKDVTLSTLISDGGLK